MPNTPDHGLWIARLHRLMFEFEDAVWHGPPWIDAVLAAQRKYYAAI